MQAYYTYPASNIRGYLTIPYSQMKFGIKVIPVTFL